MSNTDGLEIKCLDLHLKIDLPSNAPKGHPHILHLKFDDINEDSDWAVMEIPAVDAVATTLYNWNPRALRDLLDMKRDTFHWGAVNIQNFELYVDRDGVDVKIGSKKLGDHHPDFEIHYNINARGSWQLTGGSECVFPYAPFKTREFTFKSDPTACRNYSGQISLVLFRDQMWKENNGFKFNYMVDEEEMLNPDACKAFVDYNPPEAGDGEDAGDGGSSKSPAKAKLVPASNSVSSKPPQRKVVARKRVNPSVVKPRVKWAQNEDKDFGLPASRKQANTSISAKRPLTQPGNSSSSQKAKKARMKDALVGGGDEVAKLRAQVKRLQKTIDDLALNSKK